MNDVFNRIKGDWNTDNADFRGLFILFCKKNSCKSVLSAFQSLVKNKQKRETAFAVSLFCFLNCAPTYLSESNTALNAAG